MKLLILTRSLLAVSAVAFFTGCSASVKGASDLIPDFSKPTSGAFDDAPIAGPDVTGEWASSCRPKSFGEGSRVVTIQFSNTGSFKYVSTSYSDSYCESQSEVLVHEGVYQFTQKISEDLYRIDYSYVEDNVTYRMSFQRLEFLGDVIYISEFLFGEIEVDYNLPLQKVVPVL